MGLSCTLSYLLWKSSVNGKPCSGSLVKIETLSDPVNSKFIGYDATQTYTISSLLTNRLTPYQLTKENLSGLDVCKSHLVSKHCMDFIAKKTITVNMRIFLFQDWLTVSHPALKQTACCVLTGGVSKCNKKASRRVTFALSRKIFSSFDQHAPVGSG